MKTLRYVRWRLSPAGRAAYRAYARGQAGPARVVLPPAPVAPARREGYAARWQDFERPQRGSRHRPR
jgi:hypothetical protein